jgi:hypothetical protein
MSTVQERGQHTQAPGEARDDGQRRPVGTAKPKTSTFVGQTSGGAQNTPGCKTGMNVKRTISTAAQKASGQGAPQQNTKRRSEADTGQGAPSPGFRPHDNGQRKIPGRG